MGFGATAESFRCNLASAARAGMLNILERCYSVGNEHTDDGGAKEHGGHPAETSGKHDIVRTESRILPLTGIPSRPRGQCLWVKSLCTQGNRLRPAISSGGQQAEHWTEPLTQQLAHDGMTKRYDNG